MSGYLNGFFVPPYDDAHSSEDFIPIDEIGDLYEDTVQRVLMDLHCSKVYTICGCGHCTGEERRLHPHRLPLPKNSPKNSPRFIGLWRNTVEEHPEGCLLTQARDGNDGELFLKSSIFATGKRPTDFDGLRFSLCPSESLRQRQCAFGRFSSEMLSRAQIRSFVEACSDWEKAGFRQPSIASIFRSLDRELYSAGFPEGSAYASASKEGCSLVFGLIEFDVENCTNSFGQLANLQVYSNGILSSQTTVIPSDVWNGAVGAVRAMGTVQRAPYLFISTMENGGWVRQIRMFAGFSNGTTFTLSESGNETAFSSHLESRGCVRFKCLLRGDMTALFRALGLFDGGVRPHFKYRPDFLVFRVIGNKWHCYVVEVRGFPKGKFRSYDLNIATKESYFGSIDPRISFVERNGWDYTRPDFNPGKINWHGIALGWSGESQAAARWRESIS